MALKLGRLPVFIYNEPCFGEGVGEVLTPVDIDLKGNWSLIVKPDVYISTKEAFAGITPVSPDSTSDSFLTFRWSDGGRWL